MEKEYSSEILALKLMIDRTIRMVSYLRSEAESLEEDFGRELAKIPLEYRQSARNLVHYTAMRQHDIRALQQDLSTLGMTSLGGIEAHVMASLNSVLLVLNRVLGKTDLAPSDFGFQPELEHKLGDELLEEHAVAILGPSPERRNVRIMVTMPSEAADDPSIIHDLLANGMDIMRVNCAHDGPEEWLRMIHHLRQAEKKLGKPCRLSFDLGGPKLRTGTIISGPEVVRWKPARNQLGQVVLPAVIHLTTHPPEKEGVIQTRLTTGETILPIEGKLLSVAQAGDVIRYKDARGRKRRLVVQRVTETSCTCECDRTGYAISNTPLELWRDDEHLETDTVTNLPAQPQAIPLSSGDMLIVTQADRPGQPAVKDEAGMVLEPAQIGCTLPEAFRDVRVGQRIFLDDGKFSGIIREVADDQFKVEIIYAAGGTARLQAEKGINLPDTDLNLPALTEKDIHDLKFVIQHGDMVSLSFVQRSEDIDHLVSEIKLHKAKHVGIILKIEGQRAFKNLPQLLLTVLQHPPVAVMVARGDLAVEVGFERLAEVQEEILWLCEAAHVPVIWATQVLEGLAKRGVASRAEVTDAAMGVRAECVMLNKGPYIISALQFLRNVLNRMQVHQEKKRAMLRKLSVSKLKHR